MDYKEKYNQALKRARTVYTYYCDDREQLRKIESIFPELKEKTNTDERIRKGLIKAVSRIFEGHKLFDTDVTREEALAWLENQGDTNEMSAEWSEEDEQMMLSIEQVMNCASLLNIVPEKIDNIKSWLKSLRHQKQWKPTEKQGEQKTDPCTDCTNDKGCVTCEHGELQETHTRTLNADKVIEWIDEHVPTKFEDMQNYVNQFKKDFGL